MRCSVCATENDDNARYCASCGSLLHRYCSACGTQAKPDQQFCASCGEGLRPDGATPGESGTRVTDLRAGFASLVAPAAALYVAFALFITVSVAGIGADLTLAVTAGSALDGEPLTEDEASIIDGLFALMKGLQFALMTVTGPLFIWWLRRATANVQRWSPLNLPYGTGWAIGGWFVPILSLWRPYQVVAQAWRETLRAKLGPGAGTATISTGSLIVCWWIGFVLTMWLGFAPVSFWGDQPAFYDAYLTGDEQALRNIQTSAYMSAVSDTGVIAAAGLAIAIVRRLTSRQQAVGTAAP